MWMARGRNPFGIDATWVRAMSVYYRLGPEFTALLPDALPLIPRSNALAAEPILPPGGITAGQLLFAVPAGSPENLLQFMDKLRLKTSVAGRGAGNFREEEGICNCGGGRPRRRRPAQRRRSAEGVQRQDYGH